MAYPVDVRNLQSACEVLERGDFDRKTQETIQWLSAVFHTLAKYLAFRAELTKGLMSEDVYDHKTQKLLLSNHWLDNQRVCDFIERTVSHRIVDYYADDQTAPENEMINGWIQGLFSQIIDLSAHLVLFREHEDAFRAWWRIFDPESRFYRRYRGNTIIRADALTSDDPGYTSDHHQGNTKLTNYFWLGHIDRFGQLGGFDNIAFRIKHSIEGVRTDITFVNCVVRGLFSGRFGIRPELLSELLLEHVFPLSQPLLLTTPDAEFKRLPSQALQQCMMGFRELLLVAFKADVLSVVEQFAPFRMKMIRKMFAADTLERRLNAIVELDQLLSDISSPKVNRADPRYEPQLDLLVKWLGDMKVLDIVFGPHMHQELIKRVPPLLRFMTAHNMLSEHDLDLIWTSSLGKQETIEVAIHRVIAEVAVELSDEHIDYLMDKIGQLPLPSQDERMLQLVRALLRVLTMRDAYVKVGSWSGIKVLWNLIQEPPGVKAETARTALNLLMELFRSAVLHEKREEIVRMCIDNLTQFRAVLSSYRMLQLLVDKVATMWLDLHRQHGLLQLVVDELLQHRRSLAGLPMEQRIFQLQQRLEFVDTLVNLLFKAHEQDRDGVVEGLSQHQLYQMWSYLVIQAQFSDEQVLAFQWFRRMAVDSVWLKDQPDDGDETVWRKILSSFAELDLEGVGEAALQCFEACFLYVNTNECNNFVLYQRSHQLLRPVHELVGHELLWRFALRPADAAVADKAIDTINGLFDKLSPKVGVEERRAMNRRHLEHVFRLMAESLACSDLRAIDRCITLLTKFVGNDNALHRKRKWVDQPTAAGGFVPTVVDATLDEMQVHHATPSQLLAEESFETVMQALESLSAYPEQAQRIWTLINEMPRNPAVVSSMRDCAASGEQAWASLFGLQSVCRLHYVLETIQNTLQKEPEWAPKFVETGGLVQLFNVFLTNKALLQHPGCVVVLLTVLGVFCTPRKSIPLPPQIREHIPRFLGALVSTGLFAVRVITAGGPATIIEADRKEFELLRLTMGLIGHCVRTEPSELPCVVDSMDMHELLEAALTRVPQTDTAIRFGDDMYTLLVQMCFELDEAKRLRFNRPAPSLAPMRFYLLRTLLDWLPGVIAAGCVRFAHWKLLQCLLQYAPELADIEPWEAVVGRFLLLLKRCPIELSNRGAYDVRLGAMLTMTAALLLSPSRPLDGPRVDRAAVAIRELREYILNDCLLNTELDGSSGRMFPKCKTADCRRAAFDALYTLLEVDVASVEPVVRAIETFWDTAPDLQRWNFVPDDAQRSDAGYVGIKNLGCICYAIALVQQLFMLPKFRRGILSIDVEVKPDDNKTVLLAELQRMFAFLQHSQRRFFDPKSFCTANTDMDGSPMNVFVQMDADEYFNQLCDKIDSLTKGTPHEKLLQNIWGGKLSSQLICKGCPHRTEREEGFYTISIDIKDKQDIEQALATYVKGDMLEGDNAYFCERCHLKRDTLKRSCIKSLPNTLILHLKRFEFDFDQMRLRLRSACALSN
eukprot:TRINITY_DN10564_c0_g1_i1.p1 TRINITY_DN10564_c0_g1~~TRINITY_DN10564_c0_g1_i1.p1  ORF type:complete len:1509 (+),score=570.89 TRINITY_DN10564_c0_g1_i1:105-4631(+)